MLTVVSLEVHLLGWNMTHNNRFDEFIAFICEAICFKNSPVYHIKINQRVNQANGLYHSHMLLGIQLMRFINEKQIN
jgi:hypothetical protein